MLDYFGFCGLRGSVLFVWAWSLSLRALLSGHITVTDGDCRLYYTIIDISLHSYGWPACVHVMKRPYTEEWHIAVGIHPICML
jgi:hypothetical protein